MSVRIRMKKLGRRHRPFYRICAMDSRSPRDGRVIEELGHYDPMVRDKSQRVVVKMDRIDHWISVGVQPSEKVAVLLRKVRDGDWGVAKAAPAMTPPTDKTPAPEPEAAATEEGEAAAAEEAAGEETATEEAAAE